MIESRRQQFLAVLIGNWDQQFDPGAGLLAPETTPLRDSLLYALALLEQGEHSRLGRAEAIIRQVTKAQPALAADRDEWITFTLLWIWARQRRRLGTKAVEAISAAFAQDESPAETFRQRFIELTLRRSDPTFPSSLRLPAGLSLKQIMHLLVISHSDSSVRSARYKRQSQQFSRYCWSAFVDWVEEHYASPAGYEASVLDEQDSATLDLLLEKGTRGQLQVARFPAVPPCAEYVFALIGDVKAPSSFESRLIRIMGQIPVSPAATSDLATPFLIHP